MARKKVQPNEVNAADKGPTQNPWYRRLERMKKFQEQNSKTWGRNENLLFGNSPPKGIKGSEQNLLGAPQIAYAWGLVKSLETNIYVQNPECAIKPYDMRDEPAAKLLTDICQYDLDTMDVKSIGNLMLIDCFVYGYGAIVEVVENFKEKPDDDEDEVLEGQEYSFRRLHPKDILFDPQTTKLDLSDAKYIAMAWYPTIAELREIKDFKLPGNDIMDGLPECSEQTRSMGQNKIGSKTKEAGFGDDYTEKDPEYKQVCVWEIWDNVGDTVNYILDATGDQIGTTEQSFLLRIRNRKLYPVTLMTMQPMPHGFYPKPEIDLIAPQLIEINAVEAAMREAVASKWKRLVVPGGIFTPDQIGKLTDTKTPWDVVEYDTTELAAAVGGPQNLPSVLDSKKILGVVEEPYVDRELLQRKEALEADIAHIIGWGPADRGGLARTRSAREAMMVNESKNQRLQKRFDGIADCYRLMIAKHVLILQQTMEFERVAKVFPDSMGARQAFQQYKRDDISGMFHFDVFAGSSAPKTTESDQARAMQEFQAVMPVVQALGLPPSIPFQRLARAMDWKDVDEMFNGQKESLKKLAASMIGLETGQVSPAQVLDDAAAAVMKNLSPQELAMMKSMMQGNPGGGGAPAPSAPGAGQLPAGGDQNPLGTAAGTM